MMKRESAEVWLDGRKRIYTVGMMTKRLLADAQTGFILAQTVVSARQKKQDRQVRGMQRA